MRYRILILSLLFFATSEARLSHDYAQLMMMDLEQIHSKVQKKIRNSRKNGALGPLKDALVFLMSRPDDDGAIGKVWPTLHGELRSRKVYEKVVMSALDEALAGAQNGQLKAARQGTYYITLSNMVAQFGIYAKHDKVSKMVLQKIQQARIPVSKRVKNERLMRTMQETISPSKLAAAKLNALFPPPKKDD